MLQKAWKLHRRGALFFFGVIHQISRSHGLKNRRFEAILSKITRPAAAIKSLRFVLLFLPTLIHGPGYFLIRYWIRPQKYLLWNQWRRNIMRLHHWNQWSEMHKSRWWHVALLALMSAQGVLDDQPYLHVWLFICNHYWVLSWASVPYQSWLHHKRMVCTMFVRQKS